MHTSARYADILPTAEPMRPRTARRLRSDDHGTTRRTRKV